MIVGKNIFITCCLFLLTITLLVAQSSAQPETRGRALYFQYCAVCHQPDGKGIPGFFPPLADNPLVVSEKPLKIQEYLGRVIFGYHGGLMVKGELYSGTMPPIGYTGRLNESELLDLINYQRTAWGNEARPVTALELARAREIRWKWLAGTKECNMYYDSKEISFLSSNLVRVKMRTSLSQECKRYESVIRYLEQLGKEYRTYEYNIDLYEINCSNHTFKIIETSYFTTGGENLHTFKHTAADRNIPVGSTMEVLKDIVCRK